MTRAEQPLFGEGGGQGGGAVNNDRQPERRDARSWSGPRPITAEMICEKGEVLLSGGDQGTDRNALQKGRCQATEGKRSGGEACFAGAECGVPFGIFGLA